MFWLNLNYNPFKIKFLSSSSLSLSLSLALNPFSFSPPSTSPLPPPLSQPHSLCAGKGGESRDFRKFLLSTAKVPLCGKKWLCWIALEKTSPFETFTGLPCRRLALSSILNTSSRSLRTLFKNTYFLRLSEHFYEHSWCAACFEKRVTPKKKHSEWL